MNTVAAICLFASVLVEVYCSVAVLRLGDAYDRIHAASFAGLLAPPLLAIGILPGTTVATGLKLWFVVVVAVCVNAISAHVLGTVARAEEQREGAE